MRGRFTKTHPPREMIETRMRCNRCKGTWIIEFPERLRETSYTQKLKSYRCNDCNSNWREHEVLGPKPEVVPSQRAEKKPRTVKEPA